MTILVFSVTIAPMCLAVAKAIDPVTILVPVWAVIAALATRDAQDGYDQAQCAYPAKFIHLVFLP
jgi:hypothetical protein